MVALAIVARRRRVRRKEPFPWYDELGRRIYDLRRPQLTQMQLAVALGTSDATVSRWESGHQKIEIPQFLRLARLLGYEPEALLPGVPPPPGPHWHSAGDLFGVMLADLEELSPEQRELVLSFVRFLAADRRRRLKGDQDAAAGGDSAAG